MTYDPYPYVETQKAFERDTANHVMTVVRADGLYRHLTFRNPDTLAYWFDVITWPGYLTITGDMGSYVLKREADMLAWLRHDRSINPDYWSQKVQAGETRAYDVDYARHLLSEQFIDWLRDVEPDLSADEVRDGWDEIHETVTAYAEFESTLREEVEALHARYEKRFKTGPFHDLWETSFETYTWHFLWCCWAVRHASDVWAKRPYAKEG